MGTQGEPTSGSINPWPSDWSAQLAAIVEYSNDAVFSRRLDGTIESWNAAADRIFGFRADEVIGRGTDLLLPRGLRDEFRQLLARIRRGEVVQHFETQRRRKGGEVIHVSLTLSPIRDADQRLIGFSTIARDITAHRLAQEALRRSEEALADLFEEASVGLAWTTPSGRVTRANRALLGILQCSAKHCVGHLLGKFHTDRPVMKSLMASLRRRETVHNFQTVLQTGKGQRREVLVDTSAFWDEGKIAHLRWFVQDITRRKQLEREVLAISERERRTFARELHDSVGQQLSGIAYLTGVLRDGLAEAGSSQAPNAQRIAHLLKQAIEQTRAVARGLSPVRSEPGGLCSALRELAARSSEGFGIACSFHAPKPVAAGDSEATTHLYRIAQEAVHNAFQHGHARHIRILLTQLGPRVRLRVLDDGTGIGSLSPRRKGLGLRIMQYRAGLLQGKAFVRRRAGGGTEVGCFCPAKVLRAKD